MLMHWGAVATSSHVLGVLLALRLGGERKVFSATLRSDLNKEFILCCSQQEVALSRCRADSDQLHGALAQARQQLQEKATSQGRGADLRQTRQMLAVPVDHQPDVVGDLVPFTSHCKHQDCQTLQTEHRLMLLCTSCCVEPFTQQLL